MVDELDTSPATRQRPCPSCGARRSGDDRYCEACGHDFTASPPPDPEAATWEAVARADPAQFERFAVEGMEFPADYGERRFGLRASVLAIGRSRPGQAEEPAPEIDLAGAPEDPGISRRHAVLERLEDGSYAIRDLGSTNGTRLNDQPDPIGTEAAVSLAAGDRILLGAWTTITVQRTRSAI